MDIDYEIERLEKMNEEMVLRIEKLEAQVAKLDEMILSNPGFHPVVKEDGEGGA
jgi:hypothetical protein